ncbi:MAG: hypothetical protein AAGA96_19160 [Verrucomicrobiota bacterium]
MLLNSRAKGWHQGATLLEILVVVGIVGLLLTVTIPSYEAFQARARKAKCISHLRLIHAGFVGHLTDKGYWPQMEEGKVDFTEEEFFGFWVDALEPYGVNEEAWICPSDRRQERLLTAREGIDEPMGSYVISRFDDKPQTPFRWNQPWALERGNFHGKGSHMLLPDGSVSDSQNPFYGR